LSLSPLALLVVTGLLLSNLGGSHRELFEVTVSAQSGDSSGNAQLTVLHAFGAGTTDGTSPGAALIQATDGNFYGTTNMGGASNPNTVHLASSDMDGHPGHTGWPAPARPQRKLAHLAFDAARRAAPATRHDAIAPVGEFVEQGLMKGGDRLRGE
jgi:hypothetical protein